MRSIARSDPDNPAIEWDFFCTPKKMIRQRIDYFDTRTYCSPHRVTQQGLARASGPDPLFNSQRNTNKDGTASTATGDQIAPKGYQREDHLDG